jgi:hypothetical protein
MSGQIGAVYTAIRRIPKDGQTRFQQTSADEEGNDYKNLAAAVEDWYRPNRNQKGQNGIFEGRRDKMEYHPYCTFASNEYQGPIGYEDRLLLAGRCMPAVTVRTYQMQNS